ncbi:hypothetical protein BaRGS_00020906, partial [Batillaria attramentaria]
HVYAADGDVDAACTGGTGGTCTDANAYCTSAGTCACKVNFVKKGTGCARAANQPCGGGQCLDNAACTNSACTCDTANGFVTSGSTCACNSATHYLDNGKCVKKIGQNCADVSECGSGAGIICSTDCKCDASKNFVANAGSTGCGKKILSCTADTDCMANAKCDTNTNDCVCDDTLGLKASASGDSCECDTAAGWVTKSDGTCGKAVGESCTGSLPCQDKASCDGTSSTCVCDANAFFVDDGSGGCVCDTTSDFQQQPDGSCAKPVGTSCSAGECQSYATCDTGTTGNCICDASKNYVTDGATGCSRCTVLCSLTNVTLLCTRGKD